MTKTAEKTTTKTTEKEIKTMTKTPTKTAEKTTTKTAKKEIKTMTKSTSEPETVISPVCDKSFKGIIQVTLEDITILEGFNPRVDFSDQKELEESIKVNGILQPLTGYLDEEGNLALVDGERRYRAVRQLVLSKDIDKKYQIPVNMIAKPSDQEALVRAVLSNEGRRLTSLELFEAYSRLEKAGMQKKQIQARLGKSKGHVFEIFAIGKASPAVREALAEKKITLKMLGALVKAFANHKDQNEILPSMIATGSIITESPAESPAKSGESPAESPAKSKEEKATSEPEKKKSPDHPATLVPAYRIQASVQDVLDDLKDSLEEYVQCGEDTDYKSFHEGRIDALSMVLGLDKMALLKAGKVA
jgi:ParB/RepB/Spo0J family partition protein